MIGQFGENRHKMMANTIAKIIVAAVGAVIDIWDIIVSDIAVNVGARNIQQRANDIVGDSRNGDKRLNAAAAKEIDEKSLDAVIEMMSGSDIVDILFGSSASEKIIPNAASGLLDRLCVFYPITSVNDMLV